MHRIILAIAPLVAAGFAAAPASGATAGFSVVVHADNPVENMSASQLAQLFLRKERHWRHGGAVEPVDRTPDSAVREGFSESVLDRDVNAVKSYWQRQIFSGRGTPPPELATDADVLAFVRSRPGAVGYVAAGTAVGEGVRVVPVTE